jgi:hypothetical protein
VLLIIVCLPIVVGIIYTLAQTVIDPSKLIFLSAWLFIFGGTFWILYRAKKIEFDDEFMYIIGLKSEEKIPLKNIYKVKLTMFSINNSNAWKIGYYDADGKENSLRLMPRVFHYNYFTEFQNRIKSINKDVEIKNWSSSFDFDQ